MHKNLNTFQITRHKLLAHLIRNSIGPTVLFFTKHIVGSVILHSCINQKGKLPENEMNFEMHIKIRLSIRCLVFNII